MIMLKEYRKRKNISQEELEKLTNIDRKTILKNIQKFQTGLMIKFMHMN